MKKNKVVPGADPGLGALAIEDASY